MKKNKKNITFFQVTFHAFLGSIAWTAHFFMLYALGEFGCLSEFNWQLIALAITTFAFFFLGVFSIYQSWKLGKLINKKDAPSAYFLTQYGIINNIVFTFIIVYQSVPILYFGEKCL